MDQAAKWGFNIQGSTKSTAQVTEASDAYVNVSKETGVSYDLAQPPHYPAGRASQISANIFYGLSASIKAATI